MKLSRINKRKNLPGIKPFWWVMVGDIAENRKKKCLL